MPSLSEQKQKLQAKLQQEGQAQQSPSVWEQMTDPYVEAAKSFNIGLAEVLGLPGTAASALRSAMGYEQDTALPTGQEIKQGMANVGATYEPGEEPNTLFSRFMENLGASSIPIAGMAAKGGRAAVPILTELAGAGGGAVGGKALQATTWGQKNPQLARAIGELTGGIGAASPAAGGKLAKNIFKEGPPVFRAFKAPMRGRWARRRAVRSLGEQAEDPEGALRSIREGTEAAEEESLTAAQKTGDPGISSMRKQVEADLDEEAKFSKYQRSRASQDLKGRTAPGEESGADVKNFLDETLRQRAEEAKQALRRARQSDDPATYNAMARQKIEQAYDAARKEESRIWEDLPEGGAIEPEETVNTFKQELQNITEGGDLGEISQFARKKLGRLNKQGKLVGGQLVSAKKTTASPKALHQFYSRLGREVRKLSEQGGNSNEIRILNRLRSSILDDLEMSDVGDEYRKAIGFSRRLNEKFTSGDLGKVLGFQRGQATPETMTLDELLGAGGQQASERVKQLLDAAPQSEEDVKGFIRSRFAMQTMNDQTRRINAQSGQKFLKQNRALLDAFPDLKKELANAVQKQKRVDQLVGVSDVSEMSPLSRQKAAASLYLGKEDPGDAIKDVIQIGHRRGKTTEYLRDLARQTRKDPTGKAKKGLKNAIEDELIEYAEESAERGEDVVTAEPFISGRKFLRRLSQLEKPLKESGLFTEKELGRIRKIGNAFRKLETERGASKAGRVVTDMPGRMLDTAAQILGAQIGGKLGASSAGGSLQFAQIASSRMKELIRSLTADEARNLLIRATRDDELMKDLLKDFKKMSADRQKSLATRIGKKLKEIGSDVKRGAEQKSAPATAVTPALTSGAEATQAEAEKQELRRRLMNIRGQ
jgi:hypothetical protein